MVDKVQPDALDQEPVSNHLKAMKPTMKLSLIWMFAIISIGWTLSDMLDQEDKNIPSQYEASPDENTMRNALMYYLFSRQAFSGMHNRQTSDSQRKRSSAYSKQCAFNAVSCFGKK
ncbi:unnamed protein product [Larinioides sclopetarius]|uniref:Prohormone-1 n=1 Tax=Larinioides sclopetarius TaxID=280406 RepID=A0AAV1Z114_9ARAC